MFFPSAYPAGVFHQAMFSWSAFKLKEYEGCGSMMAGDGL